MTTNRENIVYSIKAEFDPGTQKALAQLEAQTNKTSNSFKNVANSAQQAGKAKRQMGYQVQNASYQIADFFVMLQGGISPLRAVSSQLPQLLAGFGPLGAAMGAVAAIGASVWVAFDNMGESADAAAKRVQAFGDAIESLAVGENASLKQFKAALEGADESLKPLIEAQYELASASANLALAKKTEELDEFVKSLAAFSEINNNIGSFDSFLPEQALQKQLDAIKDRFGAVTDEIAAEVLGLVQAFNAGEEDIVSFATALSELAVAGDVDWQITNEIVEIVGAFKQAEKVASDFSNSIDSLLDAPEPVDPSKWIDKEAMREYERLVNSAKTETDRFYDSLFNLESVRLDIGEGEFQKAYAALVKEFEDSRNKVAAELAKMDQDRREALEKAQRDYAEGIAKFADAVKRSLDPMIEFREQQALINEALRLGEFTAEEAEAAFDQLTDKYLQFVEVTATKKPEFDWDQFDLTGFQGIIQDMDEAIEGFGDSFTDSIIDATEKGMDAFKEFADFVIKEIARIALRNLIIQPLVNSLTGLLPGLGTTSIGAPSLGVIEPVTAGVTRASTAAPVSVASQVRAAASSSSGSGNVQVNVNNYGNDEVEVQQKKTANGVEIDVLIKSAVAKGIAGGDFDRVMASSFGARRLAY